MKCLAASKSTKAALRQAKISLGPKERCFTSSDSSSKTVTVPPVRHSFSMCPGTCQALDIPLDLLFPWQIHQWPLHLGQYHNSQTAESTRGMDSHKLSNTRKSPYRTYPLDWFSIQNRSKSLNVSGRFLIPIFFLPFPF